MEKRRKGEIVPTREEKLRGLPLARHWPLAPRSALILLLPNLYSDSTMNETIPAINRLGAARRGAARRFHERTLDSAPSYPGFHSNSTIFRILLIRSKKFAIANFHGRTAKTKEKLTDYRFRKAISILSLRIFFPTKDDRYLRFIIFTNESLVFFWFRKIDNG